MTGGEKLLYVFLVDYQSIRIAHALGSSSSLSIDLMIIHYTSIVVLLYLRQGEGWSRRLTPLRRRVVWQRSSIDDETIQGYRCSRRCRNEIYRKADAIKEELEGKGVRIRDFSNGSTGWYLVNRWNLFNEKEYFLAFGYRKNCAIHGTR